MFQREAIRLEFDDMTYTSGKKSGSAIKVSIGVVLEVSSSCSLLHQH